VKLKFGRYPLLSAMIIVLVILVVIAIVVQIFRQTNFFAAWIFNFVNDWATLLSATAAVIIIFMAWITIQENRRSEALNRIRTWGKEAIHVLSLNNEHDVETQTSVILFEGYAMVREGRWWPKLQVEIIKVVQSLEAISSVSNSKTKSSQLTNLISQAIVNSVTMLESASKL